MNGWLVTAGVAGIAGWFVFGYVQDPPRRRAVGLGPARWPVYVAEFVCAMTGLYAMVQTALDVGLV